MSMLMISFDNIMAIRWKDTFSQKALRVGSLYAILRKWFICLPNDNHDNDNDNANDDNNVNYYDDNDYASDDDNDNANDDRRDIMTKEIQYWKDNVMLAALPVN